MLMIAARGQGSTAHSLLQTHAWRTIAAEPRGSAARARPEKRLSAFGSTAAILKLGATQAVNEFAYGHVSKNLQNPFIDR